MVFEIVVLKFGYNRIVSCCDSSYTALNTPNAFVEVCVVVYLSVYTGNVDNALY